MHALRSEILRIGLTRSSGALCVVGAMLVTSNEAAAAVDVKDPVELYVADKFAYDDNLFRVPDGLLESDPTAVAVESVDDYINRASAGVRARWDAARQVFSLDLRLDDVRYANNDTLDHTGGNGSLEWDWQLASNWSGRLNGQYDRALASYSNYRFFGKDVLDTFQYGAELRYRIGSRWSLFGAASQSDSEHSADIRRIDNFESTTGRGGVEYRTPADNLFALEYRYAQAEFPIAEALLGPDARRYDERVPGVRAQYAFTDKTSLEAQFGYLERRYADPAAGDFSGEVWNATLRWQPRLKLSFVLKAWHELKAYADSESDYFVARGGSIGPVWEPTIKLKLSAAFATEDQQYVAVSTVAPAVQTQRRDDVQSAQIGVDYAPRDFLSFNLLYRWASRDSNRHLLGYGNDFASAQLKIAF